MFESSSPRTVAPSPGTHSCILEKEIQTSLPAEGCWRSDLTGHLAEKLILSFNTYWLNHFVSSEERLELSSVEEISTKIK